MLLESAFIEALRERPDDQTLRLVYADWLEETGNSRGELIRLQCELDGMPLGNPLRNLLHLAIRDLCLARQADWLAPLRRRVLGWQKARFQFGLVENVAMSPMAFLRHAQAGLFEEMPHLVGVRLEGRAKRIEKALASPHVGRLKSLGLCVREADDARPLVQYLASQATLRNLTSLNLAHCRAGDAAIAALLASANFPKLRRLNLQNNALTANIAGPLAQSPWLPELEMLALGSQLRRSAPNRLGDVGMRVFTETAPPLKLRWLDISANDLSDSSAWDLSKSVCLDQIECLYLGGNTFGTAARTALEVRFPNRVFFARSEPDCLSH